MARMDGPVERAYLVSVDGLRGICETLTDGKREYKLVCEDEGQVTIDYNDGPDALNAISYAFPIVASLNIKGRASRLFGGQWPFGEDGLMVCLHVYLQKQTRKGLYPEGDKLYWDRLEDWEKFWGPLETALTKGMGHESA
ncbi:MAG TPA: hypothetical protein VKP61_11190 [Candidatus Acidoferrum sp.]|nr:hypothetical protein [Candidatus Acidoferrum sp.]